MYDALSYKPTPMADDLARLVYRPVVHPSDRDAVKGIFKFASPVGSYRAKLAGPAEVAFNCHWLNF